VPAIATEGRALFDAIVAQGLAGMMARQRQGPYLPGVRSRLWRLVATAPAPGAPPAPDEAPGPGSAVVPILALIQRLPFDAGE
jgi:hypothetical protein